jgi:hypothetical protein
MKYHKILESSNLQYFKSNYTLGLTAIITFSSVILLLGLKIYPIYGFLSLHTFVFFNIIFKKIKTKIKLVQIAKIIAIPLALLAGLFIALALIAAGIEIPILYVP